MVFAAWLGTAQCLGVNRDDSIANIHWDNCNPSLFESLKTRPGIFLRVWEGVDILVAQRFRDLSITPSKGSSLSLESDLVK
jgi:hypothetical protein